ncbi:MAG: hypothetical protein COA43_14560 [Robiginitomaculum sp.]|nr:MAG: hypothetical protein COA43_14560 [Robiginitomaculum sp.]
MKGINKELNNKINSEVMIKKAFTAARETVKHQRPITRRAIEDIQAAKELKQLEEIEQEYIDE